MKNDFIKLNIDNLKSSYIWISGILNFIYILFLIFFHEDLSIKLMVFIFSLTIFMIPVLILFSWYIKWLRIRKNYERVLTKEPFNRLKEIGFSQWTLMIIDINGMRANILVREIEGWEISFQPGVINKDLVSFNVYGALKNGINIKENYVADIQYEDRYAYWECNTKGNISLQIINEKVESLIRFANKNMVKSRNN